MLESAEKASFVTHELLGRLINIIENCECIKFVGQEDVKTNKNPKVRLHHYNYKYPEELHEEKLNYYINKGNNKDVNDDEIDNIYENLSDQCLTKVGDDFYFLNNGKYKYDFWNHIKYYRSEKERYKKKAPYHYLKYIDNKEYFKIIDVHDDDGSSFIPDILFVFVKIKSSENYVDDWVNIILNSMLILDIFSKEQNSFVITI